MVDPVGGDVVVRVDVMSHINAVTVAHAVAENVPSARRAARRTAFGAEFLRSGFHLGVNDLPPGTWDVVVSIWPSGGNGFTDGRVRVTVP